jgi:hypothetical protein
VTRRLRAAASGPDGAWFDGGGAGCIGLIGEYGLVGFAIRQAQAVIRVDRTPSYWSHCFLVYGGLSVTPAVNRDPERAAWVWESTLEPVPPFNHFIERNGVGARRIADYSPARFDPTAKHNVPNIAIIAVGLSAAERKAVLDRADDPSVDQLAYDVSSLLGTWYSYITKRAEEPNPLAEGQAVYCSAYTQLAYDAASIDLAPGAHERNTSPEHIWQTAKYLQDLFKSTDAAGKVVPRPVIGWYCVRDHIGQVAPVDRGEPVAPRSLRDVMKLS